MKENRFVIWLKSKGQVVKDVAVSTLVFMLPGLIIGGTVTALVDNHRLDKLEKDHEQLISTFNSNVDKHNNFADWTHEEIEKLTRQNNELLERALQETEGKAS
jgi:hypothetical protein